MRRRSKSRALATMVIIASLAYSCGGGTLLRSFRVALASSGPLITSLQASGAFDQTKATAIIADFDAGAQCGLSLQSAFEAIPDGLSSNEVRARKLSASVDGLRCFRTIINHQNFASHPRVQQVASIAEGILASLVAFYSDAGASRASSPVGTTSGIVLASNEKELEQRLKERVKVLQEAMKP